MLVEGEEEVGSRNLVRFFEQHKKRIQSDLIVVCDTENIEVSLPCVTYSRGAWWRCCRGVERDLAGPQRHGRRGTGRRGARPERGAVAAVLGQRAVADPRYYDKVRPLSEASGGRSARCRWTKRSCGATWACYRREAGLRDGYQPFEQTWRRPALSVIAQEASRSRGVEPGAAKASAIVSCRIVPDQNPAEVLAQLTAVLAKDPPWGVTVSVTPAGGPVQWWMTDPNGPASRRPWGR